MGLIFQVVILIGALKLLESTQSPLLCAVLYALGNAGVAFVFLRMDPMAVGIGAGVTFAYGLAWFYLLNRFSDEPSWKWILILGLVIPFAVNFVI